MTHHLQITAQDIRNNIIDPVILDILTRDVDWRYDGPGIKIPEGMSLNEYLERSSQATVEWLSQNEDKARIYLYWDGENEDDDICHICCDFPHELARVAGISVVHSMHACNAETIFEKRITNYLRTIIKN